MTDTTTPFIDIAISLLQQYQGKLRFDIYVKRTEIDYTKILLSGDEIDWERVEMYQSKGIDTFSVPRGQYDAYLEVVEEIATKNLKVGKDLSREELVNISREMLNISAFEVLQKTDLSPQKIENASKAVSGCLKSLSKNLNPWRDY